MLGLLAIAATLIALVAAGCGSGGGDSTTAPGEVTGPTPGSGSGSTAGGRGSSASKEASTSEGGSKKTAKAGSETNGGGPQGNANGEKGASKAEKRHAAKVKRKLKKACPEGMDENTCRDYVESSLEAEKGTNSTRVSGPRDCTKVMSRAECEELLQQQKQAAAEEGSGSVNVEQCVAHPTPHCEEVLGEEAERQQAAQQAGG